jgi:HlyD family secretion protein
LQLGQPEQALILARGGFHQKTGGNWVFLLNESGTEATKQPIRINRQNPQFFEIIDGLKPGDRVITSSYDTYGDADKLILN